MVVRAKIVLASGEGASIGEISKKYSLDQQVVRRWIKRYIAEGYDGLRERKRTGRPSVIDPKVWQKLATLVVQSPEKFGLPLARWSVRELSAFLRQRYGWTVGRTSISDFLRSMALRPHKVRYWLNPSDPDFSKKAARICKLYVSPPVGTSVLSLDEKPGIQALKRIHPTRPLRPGKPTRVEFEYERKGTRNLFAAFNVKSGQVLVWTTPERSIPWVLSFLDQVLRWVRRGPIVIITDNISTRTGEDATLWLAKHPRVRFVFTPKHGSWLNQVEIWFSILTSKALRYRSFDSLRDLERAIYRFARHWNDRLARPFEWTYTGKVLKA
jgi:transposase